MLGRLLIVLLLAASLSLAACDAFGGDSGGEESPPAAPTNGDTSGDSSSADDALRLYVERRLSQGFVADCEDAQRPGDVGKQCASFRGERGNMRAYELGPTFAEYTRLIVLERLEDESWTIAHLESRDPSQPPAPGIPWPLAVGERVIVAGTAPQCLRVRDAPDQDGTEITCLLDGTQVTITDGPVEADSFQWWQLDRLGWSASNWLRYPEEVPEQSGDAEGG
jgi:hypothetical protein